MSAKKQRLGSVVYQVTETMNTIFTPGVSRHSLKAKGIESERIVSIGTMQSYIDVCCRLAKRCRSKYSVRDIRRITPEMAKEYLLELCDEEHSGGYIGKVQSAIRKFDAAMKHRGWRAPNAPELLQVGEGWHSDPRPERAYSPDKAGLIIDNMREHARDKQTPDVARLQLVAGLRIKEAVMIRGQDIDMENCIVNLVVGTKGGRPRSVQLNKRHQPFLKVLKARADPNRDGHVFRGRGNQGVALKRRTRDAIRHACERLGFEYYGTHGLRRTWAQQRYRILTEQNHSDRESRRSIAKELGHGRIDVTYSYVPRRSETFVTIET
jgi:integrase